MIDELYNFSEITLSNGEICKEPRLPIILRHPERGTEVPAMAIVDTGANSCLFSQHACDAIGHKFDSPFAKTGKMFGIEGQGVDVRKHTFEIDLMAWHGRHTAWTSGPLEIDCFESDDLLIIVGVKDFLKHFKVTFDYPNNKLHLQADA